MSREIKVLHLEPTDVCQAACPLCARETDKTFNKNTRHHLRIEQIQSAVDQSTLENLEKMFMCGNYGDPAAGENTLDIYRWIRSINPAVALGMNTNGGLRDRHWWRDLAAIMTGSRDYVVFSIDGLEDTNHFYRVNVDFQKVIDNARAFIDAGGSAHWDMLIYQHNEHQIADCEKLAKELGFRWFRSKVSKRPLVGALQFPNNWKSSVIVADRIDCHVLKEQSIYIDAQGRVHPCCWLGSRQQNFVADFDSVQQSWATDNPNPVCVKSCGSSGQGTGFTNQWRKEIQL